MRATSDMTVSAWRNTSAKKTGGTIFGLRLGKPLRDRLLDRGVDQVTLTLAGGPSIEVTLKDAFWNKCPEFKHPEIGPWMQNQGILIPWPRGKPPKFLLKQVGSTKFQIQIIR